MRNSIIITVSEAPKRFEIHEVKIIEGNETIRLLHSKRLTDDECVYLVSLGLADVILPHRGSLNRVNDTNIIATTNQVRAIQYSYRLCVSHIYLG